jgi:hypothetical protein
MGWFSWIRLPLIYVQFDGLPLIAKSLSPIDSSRWPPVLTELGHAGADAKGCISVQLSQELTS